MIRAPLPAITRAIRTGIRTAFLGALLLVVSACGADLTPSPSASATPSPTTRPSASPAPSASASASPSATPLPGHCPGTDRSGKAPGPSLNDRSENWAGYVVYDPDVAITCVEGSWVQPAVTCPSTGEQDVAIWVGIDGVKSSSAGVAAGTDLVQIGTQAGCKDGRASAFAWYEVIPEDPLSVGISGVKVAPGDTIRAMVSFARDVFTLLLVDETSGDSFSIARGLAHARRQTAEWIVEAPMIGCPADCVIAALPRFGKVTFSGAFASTAAQRAAIDDDAWTHGTTELVRGGIVRAAVSRLGAEGTSFSVVWKHR